MAARITLAFRYDDYCAGLGDETAAKDDVERRLLAAFRERGVPLTLGVVPDYERRRRLDADGAKLAALREATAGGCEAALHGLTHESSAPPGARHSEFAGQPPDRQAERLLAGKVLLEEWLDVPVVSFIPPWNTMDEATGAALASSGFRAVSLALSEPAVAAPLVDVPHTCGLGELRRTLRWLARRGGEAVVASMFHHFSFTDSPDRRARLYAQVSLAGLGELLAWCRSCPGVEVATVGAAAERCRAALSDGRVEEARERWRLVFGWRRVPVVGRAMRRLWAPRALLEPGAWARGNRWLRLLARRNN